MAALVIAEHDNASIKGSTLNTVTAALACDGEVHVLVAGENAGAAATAAAQIAGVAKVLHADGAGLGHGLAENLAAQVVAIVTSSAGGYSHLLFPATAAGKNVSPRVPTEGMPSHQERGLAAMSRHLGSMQALTEYLGFLMADGSSAFADRLRITRRGKGAGAASASKPLLEVLMQALVMQPEVLSDVEALLSAVGKDAGDWIADPSFQALWAAIRDAKGALLGLSS